MDHATAIDDDASLLRRWVDERDADAFAQLVRRHAGLVLGTCRRIVRDHHAAEDVTQECLAEFARKAATIRTSVPGYLHALATTRARNRVRDDATRRRHEARASADRDAVAATVEWDEVAPELDSALAALDETERLPLVLHFLVGRSQVQVARELGCDQATVSRRIASGVDALRSNLRRAGITASVAGLSATLAARAAEPVASEVLVGFDRFAHVLSAYARAKPWSLPAKLALAAFAATAVTAAIVAEAQHPPPPASIAPAAVAASPRWAHGLPDDPSFFPIGVWMQDPVDAAAWRKAGVNVYVGLWYGASDDSLAKLASAGMRAICDQDEQGLRHRDDATIAGWLIDGDPDLSQGSPPNERPPVPPTTIAARAEAMRAADATRPTWLLLGGGVVDPDDARRAERRGHAEDYPAYAATADGLGVQCYPINDDEGALSGQPRAVGVAVDRLRGWSGDAKPVWSWIETTRIHWYSRGQPTPRQVRQEAWLALIHGAQGLVWFCHELREHSEDDAALLHDPVMLATVTALDAQVASLAPVLHAPPIATVPRVADAGVEVHAVMKRAGGATWIIAACARGGDTSASFTLERGRRVTVIGEDRSIPVRAGAFSDVFAAEDVHLYRIDD